MASAFTVVEAIDATALQTCRELFVEYQRATGVALCFQGFDRELATLPGEYAAPHGMLLLARADGEPAGCVAMRRLPNDIAEMKRLYVRPAFRGMGLARDLAQRVIDQGRQAGCSELRLDTLPTMAAAQKLYETLGFVDTAPYNDNPVEGVRFMALDLAPSPVCASATS